MNKFYKKVLITGGTGTLGKELTKQLLNSDKYIKKIYIYSRDEYKQSEMKKEFKNHPKLSFFIGDIRDKDRLYRAFNEIDYVIHTAAQKHVPSCEYNPFEAVKTNVIGSANIIDAAIDRKVEKVLAISTDKAVNPVNLYGCTKACMEKMFIDGNNYSGDNETIFSIVRYGNVIGSRGSVIPFFKKIAKEGGKFPLTDNEMTRFWTTVDNAAKFVLDSLEIMKGQEIFIPKLPTLKISDLIKAIKEDAEIKIVGLRKGEKIHETLISKEESKYFLDMNNYFILTQNAPISKFQPFEYTSKNNDNYLSIEEMRKLL
ncbi:UDP-N-acetylglucosamine 4,6-dehydratase (inverting) [Arcobacter sp.]|uniref:UDP-N-acetylglucosamine 4,6-dehydratase (inverting) n=1 Tax=Arcobacter sp. TaxID=1872629 RepID=UPI003D11F5DA